MALKWEHQIYKINLRDSGEIKPAVERRISFFEHYLDKLIEFQKEDFVNSEIVDNYQEEVEQAIIDTKIVLDELKSYQKAVREF